MCVRVQVRVQVRVSATVEAWEKVRAGQRNSVSVSDKQNDVVAHCTILGVPLVLVPVYSYDAARQCVVF